jgi:hypothetical protein
MIWWDCKESKQISDLETSISDRAKSCEKCRKKFATQFFCNPIYSLY